MKVLSRRIFLPKLASASALCSAVISQAPTVLFTAHYRARLQQPSNATPLPGYKPPKLPAAAAAADDGALPRETFVASVRSVQSRNFEANVRRVDQDPARPRGHGWALDLHVDYASKPGSESTPSFLCKCVPWRAACAS